MPDLHMQVPLLHIWSVPHFTLAQGSVITLPPVLLMGVPAEPAPLAPPAENEPPVATLIPPLEIAPAAPDTKAPPAPAWIVAGAPLVPTGLLPAPLVAGSPVVPPELHATKQSKGATEKSWVRGFDQEWVRMAESVTSTRCRQARPSARPENHQ